MPAVPVAGTPLRVAVPFPLSTKATLAGRLPLKLKLGVGVPVAVTRKLPLLPSVKVVLLALLKADDCVTLIVAL